MPFLKKCRDAGKNVVITSQVPYDSVKLSLCQSGQKALDLGAVSAGVMTVEATVTKTMRLMGKEVAGDEFKTQFEQNLAGERTN